MTLIFSKTVFDQSGNNGLGEWGAFFAPNEGLAHAFKNAAAKPGLKGSNGVTMNMTQIDDRIGQLRVGLENLEKQEPVKAKVRTEAIAQLETGRRAIEHKLGPKTTVGVAYPARAVS